MNAKDFDQLQVTIDELMDSLTTEKQKSDLTLIIRLVHKNLHLSNTALFDLELQNKKLIDMQQKNALFLLPVESMTQ